MAPLLIYTRRTIGSFLKPQVTTISLFKKSQELSLPGILQLVLLDAESRRNVPEWLLRIANDRVALNKYPWGSYVWPTLYSQLKNANVRRWGPLYVDQPTNEDDPTTYSIFGYTWAFNTWILESFRVTAIRYFDRFNWYPKVAAWSKKNGMFLVEMGNTPVARLTPDDNEARSDCLVLIIRLALQITIETQHDDGIVDQVRRGNYKNVLHFLNNPYQIYLDCYKRLSYGTPIGWLGGEHMNSWMELMIRRRPLNANWTVAYTSTISVHPENNQFIILKDPYVVKTLDGFTRPYPSCNDVDWVFLPIHVAGNHWATGVIYLANSHFYVFDSMFIPLSFQAGACSLSTLYWLKILHNRLELSMVFKTNLDSMKLLEKKLL
uniref:Ubiquitin-like protease family profile domain-containing protein n=1 Tax=Tanacetum cinerariifolium TaxID=118510 RepID=A0A6L2NPY0_TANCI|nr:hypothetical protein [Tanacetum cinerariifolium]